LLERTDEARRGIGHEATEGPPALAVELVTKTLLGAVVQLAVAITELDAPEVQLETFGHARIRWAEASQRRLTRRVIVQENRLHLAGNARLHTIDEQLEILIFVALGQLGGVGHTGEAPECLPHAQAQKRRSQIDLLAIQQGEARARIQVHTQAVY
jgi:hypothetical protein